MHLAQLALHQQKLGRAVFINHNNIALWITPEAICTWGAPITGK